MTKRRYAGLPDPVRVGTTNAAGLEDARAEETIGPTSPLNRVTEKMELSQNWVTLDSAGQLDDLELEAHSPGAGLLPPLIHFVWLGPSVPPRLERRLATWAALNPGSRVLLWRDAPIEAIMERETACDGLRLLRLADNPAAASDLARFAILRRFGGLYFDADMLACRPVSALFEESDGFVVRESRWLLVASALGLPPSSEFAYLSLVTMQSMVDLLGSLGNYASGPPLVTELHRVLRRGGSKSPVILEPWTFFPDNPFRFPQRITTGMPPYAIHLFDHTWSVGGEFSWLRRLARLCQPVTPRDIAIGRRRQVQLTLRREAARHVAVLGGRGVGTSA